MNPSDITQIGKYEVVEILGRGGMGLVYRAIDKTLGREVAIKTITEGLAGDADMLQRFYREAAKTGILKHPNVVTVYLLGEQDGFPYIVMEYVPGEPLDKIIRSGKPLTLSAKLRIVEQVCQALAYAHQNDVIHRDVKPANIIVQPDGVAKLLDFGIARERQERELNLTRTGNIIGTVQYMAPERLSNHPFDGRSDIFSAGVVMYQLLTGQLPFSGEDYTIVQKILTEDPPPLSNYVHEYPAALDGIIARALAKEPKDRYSAADELAADLHPVIDELKKEIVLEMFQEAEKLVHGSQYTKAREVLLRLVKLDGGNTAARQLMVEVQHTLSLRQRAEQIQQFSLKAKDELRERHYDEAINCLEQALKLDPSSSELSQALQSAKEKKDIRARIEVFVRQADGVRQKGDFGKAQSILARAMDLDKEDSGLRAAYFAVVKEAEEVARQERSRELLESARAHMSARRYDSAMELLREIERVDPGNPEYIPLLRTAQKAKEQEERRRLLEHLQREVDLASTAEQLAEAAKQVNASLDQFPNDAAILKLQAGLNVRIQELDTRRMVEETIQQCHALLESQPEESLRVARERLQQFPRIERLQVLLASLEDHVKSVNTETLRSDYLGRARDALRERDYRGAAEILEHCRVAGCSSPEIEDLLAFARGEADRQDRSGKIESSSAAAERLLSAGDYAGVVELLTPLLESSPDPSLQSLLDRARQKLQAIQAQIASALQTVQELEDAQQFEEAVSFLEGQPRSVLESKDIQEALQRVERINSAFQSYLKIIGSAYAALDRTDLDSGWHMLQTVLHSEPGSVFLNTVVEKYGARRTMVASNSVTGALHAAEAALARGNATLANELLAAAEPVCQYVAGELQERHRTLRKRVRTRKLLGYVGLNRPDTT